LKNVKDPDMVVIQPTAPELNKKALAPAREVLARRRHFNPKEDKAVPAWDTIEDRAMINAFSMGLQVVLGLIGMVTLGVGGVGVMNIMLVSVSERTREIGLRKAVGARPRHILVQFLLEALVLTFLGGVIGMGLAAFLAWAIPPIASLQRALQDDKSRGRHLLAHFRQRDGDIVLHSLARGNCVRLLPCLEGLAHEPDRSAAL